MEVAGSEQVWGSGDVPLKVIGGDVVLVLLDLHLGAGVL
jgi:hypothetical protein